MAQADITDELIRIKGEERGEVVRDSIISAFNKLNSTPGSANSINGYTAKDLVLKEDVADILPLEDELKEFGSRAVKSGAIYNYLEKVDNVLDGILGGSSTEPYSSTSIHSKLNRINTARKQIRGAIIAKQVEVDKDASFRSYADKVKAIPDEAEIQTSEITISENGEYDAGKGKAYSVVTVEAKPKTATKSISKVGTYKAEDDDVEAYSEVDVDISSGVTSKTITAEDLSKDSYETTIKASDEEDKELIGYSEVSIDVSGKFQELQEEVDPGGGNADFEFDAKDEELYGYSKITITVTEITGPFTVEFYDGDSKLYTDENVPKNGSCTYKGKPKLEKKGYVFQGWEPNPVDVTKNMKTYATWKKQKGSTDFTKKTWNEITENGGMDAVAGETEKRIFWNTFEYGSRTIISSGSAIAKCVYIGEAGTSSTWVMTANLMFQSSAQGSEVEGLTYFDTDTNWPPQETGLDAGFVCGYEDSRIAKFLSSDFLQAIYDVEDQEYLANIRPVTKWTNMSYDSGYSVEKLITCSGLWLLSAQEMGSKVYEKNGVSYPDFDGTINTITRTTKNRTVQDWPSGVTPSGGRHADQIQAVYFDTVGDSGFKIPAHVWWNETAAQAVGESGTPGSLWRAINDGTLRRGYTGSITVGFCL